MWYDSLREDLRGKKEMVFLLLAILSSSVLAVVLKYLNTDNTYGVYFINYVTCALLAFLFLEPKSLWNGDALPLGLGAFSGLLYLAALAALGGAIRKSGAVLSSVFSRLGVVVPILLSICLFGERPSLFQGAGLVLTVLAVVVMNLRPGGLRPDGGAERGSGGWRTFLPLLLVLLLNGSSDSMSKVFAQAGLRRDDGLFVFYTFLFAAVFTLAPLLRSHKRLGKRDLLFGAAVGVPNFMASRFLLASLSELPAFFAYPTYSVGAIVVISALSFLLFREKLDKRQLTGVGLILGALVLLNL